MSDVVVPDDFPIESVHGSIGGYQVKLLLRRERGRFVSGPTAEEIFARYEACEDLAQQLLSYVQRKCAEDSFASVCGTLCKVEASVSAKVSEGRWDMSPAEVAWVMKRVRALLETVRLGRRGE